MSSAKFTYPFCYTPCPEIRAEASRLIASIRRDPELSKIFAEGKMLGILMVEENPHQQCETWKSNGTGKGTLDETKGGMTENQHRGFLYAFSGSVGGKSVIKGFVPPIYDLLSPGGYYKQKEAEISRLNEIIKELSTAADDGGTEVSGHPIRSGVTREEAEVPHKGVTADIPVGKTRAEATEESLQERLSHLKAERRRLSEELQGWIFDQYRVHNALGQCKTIREVFEQKGLVPPGGTGDCAAPKLLNYAYQHGLKPLAMGEVWYGASPYRELRLEGSFYPSCTGKCGPLLSWMMHGLQVEPNPLDQTPKVNIPILYEDDYLLVIDKPAGVLSVPGRTDMQSVPELLRDHNHGKQLCSCHRLDMDTSGLMVNAKNNTVKAAIERQFAERTTSKKYRARLSASNSPMPPMQGTIDLPLALDYYDRPRQIVDYEHGKPAITDYRIIKANADGTLEVEFTPHTGRSHQLRVHAAHPQGLGRPIVGDRLYGGDLQAPTITDGQDIKNNCAEKTTSAQLQLYLQAVELSFTHPVTLKRLSFSLPTRW